MNAPHLADELNRGRQRARDKADSFGAEGNEGDEEKRKNKRNHSDASMGSSASSSPDGSTKKRGGSSESSHDEDLLEEFKKETERDLAISKEREETR